MTHMVSSCLGRHHFPYSSVRGAILFQSSEPRLDRFKSSHATIHSFLPSLIVLSALADTLPNELIENAADAGTEQ